MGIPINNRIIKWNIKIFHASIPKDKSIG
jgi:hypothetical protein